MEKLYVKFFSLVLSGLFFSGVTGPYGTTTGATTAQQTTISTITPSAMQDSTWTTTTLTTALQTTEPTTLAAQQDSTWTTTTLTTALQTAEPTTLAAQQDSTWTTTTLTTALQTTEPTTLAAQQGSSSCAAPLDLFFLLDGSGSVNAANFDKVKQFAVNVVNTFDVSPAATRVGVVQYSDRNSLVFNLGNKVNKPSTVSAINGISYQSGGTNTGAALKYVRQYAAWREGNVPKVIIVLTDGKSSDSVSGPSRDLVAAGVEVYAIGVGNFDHGQLLQIANNKQNNVIELNNFNALATKIDMISTNVCSYALHVPTPANELSASTTCTNDFMELSIPEDQLTDINLGNLHWEPDQNCGASTNGTHYIFRTELYSCGTQVTFGPKYVTFLNTINILGIHLSGGVITREGDISITSKCKYERQEWVDSTFLPIPGGLNFTEEGFGQLEVRLSMFPTRQYQSSYRASQYPVPLRMRQHIYMQLEVQGHGQNLSVLALNCKATMSPNPNDTLKYPLIRDGCGSDPTLQTYNINDNSKERFGFEAFRFIREVKTVYVHCEVMVCNGADSGSRCAQGCVRRGKRAAEEKTDMKGRHMIYQGPIILDDDKEETLHLMSDQETASSRHSAPWAMLAAGGGLMALALVVMGAAIVLKRSRREEWAYQSLPNMAEDGE
ncbi:scavenger receptor cysteine-rich domain-containing protein DMBT1-like isoform X1 [Branchiostoma floridae x Branchiostoma japonicum]